MHLKFALSAAIAAMVCAPAAAELPREHVFSMSFKVTALNGELRDAAVRRATADWLRTNGFSRVWLESYRHAERVPDERLAEMRDFFAAEGFDTAGLVTPTCLNDPAKAGERPPIGVCWSDPVARTRLAGESARVARLFDTVLLDDFLFASCGEGCPRCRAAKEKAGEADWGRFRRALMLDVCRELILAPARQAKPSVRFIIKFPCWYRFWEDRGYSPLAESELFGASWVGTETRDANPDALQACWIVGHLQRLSGGRCLGGWYDALDSKPEKFLEQARYTILGGARESLVHCYDYLLAQDPGVTPFGEKAGCPRECADIFAANSASLRRLAARVAGAESLGFRMLPSGVSKHRFRRGSREFEVFVNTRDEAADGIPAHGMRTDDPMFVDGDTVVFFGDSITHGGRYHEFLADYYRTRFPKARIRFVNSGVGGDTASGAMRRVEEEVLAHSPTHVVFHFGMNDVNRGAFVANPSEAQVKKAESARVAYERNLAKLTGDVRAALPEASFVYMTPTHYDDTAAPTNIPAGATGWAVVNQQGCNAGLGRLAEFVLDRAQADGALAVDLHTPMNEVIELRRRTDPHFMLTSWDRVHPGAAGHSIMAWTFLFAQGAPSVVSDVAVDVASKCATKAVNAEVSDVAVAGDGVEFTVLAGSIPFPVAPEARPFLAEFDVERRLNAETLAVTGLAPGEYALSIDGCDVGVYSAAKLAAGISLGFNPRTPQYRQAQQVFAAQAEVSGRERKLRNVGYPRWYFSSRTDVDDVESFRKWAKDHEREIADDYFAQFIPQYCDSWPRRNETLAKLAADSERVRALARPVARRYRLVRSGDAAAAE